MRDYLNIIVVDDESLIRKSIAYEFLHNKQTITVLAKDETTFTKDIRLLATFGTKNELFEFLDNQDNEKPDYALVDMQFPNPAEPTGGITLTKEILGGGYKNSDGDDIKIVIITSRFDYPSDDEINRDQKIKEINKVIADSLEAGARAFVSKNATEGFEIENFTRAIACLERGEKYYFNHPVLQTLVESAQDNIQKNLNLLEQRKNYDLDPREIQLLIGLARGETAIQIANRIYGKADDGQIKAVQNLQRGVSERINNGDNKASALVAKAIFLGILTEKDVYRKG